MKHIFVINPTAGEGSAVKELTPEIIKAAGKAGIDYEIYITKNSADAESFVRQKALSGEAIRVYSCGGDGTLNEVANGIYGHPKAELAIIPKGTGNDFIKSFTNSGYFGDVGRQIDGSPVMIDAIAYNDRICVNVCNIGFDSAIAKRIEGLKSYPFLHGKAAYIAGIFLEFFKRMGNRLTVTFDDYEEITGVFLLFAAGSGGYYGGGFHALPKASTTDGLMDVCLVRKINRLRMLSLIADYKAGRHLDNDRFKDYVIYRKCKTAAVVSKKPFLLCADGEVSENTEVKMNTIPHAIRLSLPKGCEIERTA